MLKRSGGDLALFVTTIAQQIGDFDELPGSDFASQITGNQGVMQRNHWSRQCVVQRLSGCVCDNMQPPAHSLESTAANLNKIMKVNQIFQFTLE